jgi:Tol biopolymer transport system component
MAIDLKGCAAKWIRGSWHDTGKGEHIGVVADGTAARRRLSDTPGLDGTWLPSGELVVAHANKISVVGQNGSMGRDLVDFGEKNLFAYWLRVSPDSRFLRFTLVNTQGNSSLAQVSVDGAGYHHLLANHLRGDDLGAGNWTPDGRYFIFRGHRSAKKTKIRVVRTVLHILPWPA